MEAKITAINYIKTLNSTEKQKLKTMLSHKVQCGRDFAIKNNVDPVVFNNELKSILEVNDE